MSLGLALIDILFNQDWECMTDLLIEEPGPNEEELDDKQETSLIEVMIKKRKKNSMRLMVMNLTRFLILKQNRLIKIE